MPEEDSFRCRREGCPHWHQNTDYSTSTHRYCCNGCRRSEGYHTRSCTGWGEAVGLHSTFTHPGRSIRRHGYVETDPFAEHIVTAKLAQPSPAYSDGQIGSLFLASNYPYVRRHSDRDPEEEFPMSVGPPIGLNLKSLCLDVNGRRLSSNSTCTPMQYIEALTGRFNMQLSEVARYEWNRTSEIIESNYCTPPSDSKC